MSLVKIPFIAAGTLGTYACLTPPQPKVSAAERPKDATTWERVFSATVRFYVGTFKALACSGGILEIAVILASRFPAHPLSQKILRSLVRGHISLTGRIDFSPLFFAGCGLAAIGGFIRYQCYRTLGRFFTYEVTIRNDHQLITEGPYGWVRHPSYTSGIACCVGLGICYGSAGSWLRECRILETLGGKVASWLYVAFVVYGTASLVVRAPLEDKLLRERFGEQWDEWAKKVPYRMVPFIY
ncbi:hypothetical protein POSPLADRAFT_1146560 [Postia placenta MAD-698-R-SB12]|uniref:Protein-S-isoprenylcysteine O-methyltransferase n=1 Tax=Postia placenta MAD-698-R-SB12 TaxID=670580 RepID=A0A1X6MXX3_9APHY|nr:hypothetical protein POSPLADRAFT_1146560 [Postia placenta MAD-698-R-SB12]OSX61090.1 hypothetical protein POSPLADRAFT_1146560 [Postia placenta MAD-698-R-SB12]